MRCIYMVLSGEIVMADDLDAAMPPIRLPRSLLQAARAEAGRRDETLSQVVRRALREYVAIAPRQGDIETVISASRRRAPSGS